MSKVGQEAAKDEAADAAPLSAYFDDVIGWADLTKFDPAERLTKAGNGEGTIYVSSLTADVPLTLTGLAMQQVGGWVGG
jgi:hypothetical protein